MSWLANLVQALVERARGRTTLDREIANVQRVMSRLDDELDEMREEFHREQLPCCPSCAFGGRFSTRCEKWERQAAWLVVLLRKRGAPGDAELVGRLLANMSGARP